MSLLNIQRTLRYAKLTPILKEEKFTGRDAMFVAQDIQDLWNSVKFLEGSLSSISSSSSSGSSTSFGDMVVEREVPSGLTDGTNAVFTLTYTPISIDSVIFAIEGGAIEKTDILSLVGNEITLTFNPFTSSPIEVTYIRRESDYFIPGKYGFPTGSVDGVNSNFTLPFSYSDEKSVYFTVDGRLLVRGIDYNMAGSDVAMSWAPSFGSGLFAYADIHQSLLRGIRYVYEPLGGSGTTYYMSNVPASSSSVIVVIDSNFENLATDYTVSGKTVTFGAAPAATSKLYALYPVYTEQGLFDNVRTVTTNAYVSSYDDLVIGDSSFSNVSLFLPDPSIVKGKPFSFARVNTGANYVRIDAGAKYIGGGTSTFVDLLLQDDVLNIESNGVRYIITG